MHLAHRREMKSEGAEIVASTARLHLAHRREMKRYRTQGRPSTVASRAQAGNENVVAVACMVGLGCISPVAGNEKMERTSRCDSAKISEGAGNASMNMGHGATPPKAACSDAGGFSMPTIARQMERMRSFPHFQSGNRDFRGSEYKKIPIPSFAGFLHPLPASGMM